MLSGDVLVGSILLKKYFGGVERNLQELLLRFLRSDARDYMTFARFLASFDFRLFQHYRSLADFEFGASEVSLYLNNGHGVRQSYVIEYRSIESTHIAHCAAVRQGCDIFRNSGLGDDYHRLALPVFCPGGSITV
jgi:hypothetical protein